MTDRELLELAAKAAGYEFAGYYFDEPMIRSAESVGEACRGNCISWNPLDDDGDALRLALKLGIDLRLPSSPNQVFVQVGERGSVPFVLERIDGSPLSATRRAIVRAAAEIGKAMP